MGYGGGSSMTEVNAVFEGEESGNCSRVCSLERSKSLQHKGFAGSSAGSDCCGHLRASANRLRQNSQAT